VDGCGTGALKILLTVHQFFPDFAAGTEVLTRSVALELMRRGHQVHVLTAFPSEHLLADDQRCDEYDVEGIHVYRFHHAYTPMAGQNAMVALSYDNHLAADYFSKIVARFKPDVVHFFHLNRLGTGLIDRAVQTGLPAFMTPTDFWSVCPTAQLVLCNGQLCQGPGIPAGNCVKHFAQSTQQGLTGVMARWLPTPAANLLVRWTQAGVLPTYPHRAEVSAIGARLASNVSRLNKLTKILAPNRPMRDLLVRHGVLPSLVTLAGYGIDLAAPAQGQRPPPRQPLRIGFIGTLARHKGCHVLIEAFKALPPGRAALKIYGNVHDFPGYAQALQQSAGQHPGIVFCGVFPNANIAQVLAGLDVLVVPSLWAENTPLVLHSAQAARCVVVASDFAGIAEVIEHEVNGLLFKAGNAAALTRQLTRLTGEPGLAERLSANTRPPKSTARYVDELLTVWQAA